MNADSQLQHRSRRLAPPGPSGAAGLRWFFTLLGLTVAISFCTAVEAQVTGGPTAGVAGGANLPDGTFLPRVFTWGSRIGIRGAGWAANETLNVHIVGPINLPNVAPKDLFLGTIVTDPTGSILPGIDYNPSVPVPYKTNAQQLLDTARPGSYQLYLARPNARGFNDVAYAFPNINISPRTIPTGNSLFTNFWVMNRGGRDGQLEDKSPERGDPEWISVWNEQPVAFYATVAETDTDGGNQPAFVSHEDFPGSHYAHDVNLLLLPDPEFLWLLADANYNISPFSGRYGRIEWEWETLNNGRPLVGSYGSGNIGFPLWAMPSAGDRIFTVGRWAMDNGHPDSGDRTEIHPARMIAAIRKRNSVVRFANTNVATRASQVDIYVSGHGGGANQFPDGLSSATNRGGAGGGLLSDVLSPDASDVYFSFGPSDSFIASLLTTLLGGHSDQIKSVAGPSAFGWLNGPEERPVNDMDYDFDVSLPAPPSGVPANLALYPLVQATTHPEHTTGVTEVVTYTNISAATGLPTTAHIHLPYKGADSGIYARTLKFSWSEFNPPGKHYTVKFNELVFFLNTYMTGRAFMWADVCGQWAFLTGINPDDFLRASTVLGVGGLGGTVFDVYLDPGDTLRVFSQGYDQEIFDSLFGVDVGKTAYEAAIDLAEASAAAEINSLGAGDGENVDLGGALFAQSALASGLVGRHISNAGFFYEDFTVNYVPRPPKIVALGAPVDFGHVPLGTTSSYQTITFVNRGENPDHSTGQESPLVITDITVSGGGFSAIPDQPLPITITGSLSNLYVYFSPTSIDQGAGTITVHSNDPLNPTIVLSLRGIVDYPAMQVTVPTDIKPTVVIGSSATWAVTLKNKGTSALVINRMSMDGAGFTVTPTFPTELGRVQSITLAPGASTTATVTFTAPSVGTRFEGTLSLTSNDPIHPSTTLTFGAEGVPVGIRVLVLNSDGTPCPTVDKLTLKSFGVKPKTKIDDADLPLQTIDPPQSWQRIQYHLMTALEPSIDSGDSYEIKVKVGKKTQTATFTLGSQEFKRIVITLP